MRESTKAASARHATPTPLWERIAIFAFGVTFVSVLLALAFAFPDPTPFQYTTCRIILALSASAVATLITGFLFIEISGFAKTGNALAVFFVVFFYSPAALVVNNLSVAEQNMNTKHFDSAERRLKTTLLGNPANREALNMLGAVYWKIQRPADALEQFKKAADLAAGDERDRYLHNVAAAEIKLGRFDAAAKTLKHVLTRDPDDLSTQYNYGIAQAHRGRYDEARAIFKRLYEIGERGYKDYRPTAALQLGLIDLLEGHQDRIKHAIAHFEEAVRVEQSFQSLFLQVKTVVSDEDFELESRLLDRIAGSPEYCAFKTSLLEGRKIRSSLYL